jgi:transcriptional regulator with XRE-family HTH domain
MTIRKLPTPDEIEANIPGFAKAKSIGDRIRMVREWRGVTQQTLSENVAGRGDGKDGKRARSSVSQWERNISVPPYDKLEDVADFLKVPPSFLAFGSQQKTTPPDPNVLGYALIPEVVFESATNKRNGQIWGVPTGFLRNEMNVINYDNLIIHKVDGGSETYDVNDRVLVDLGQNKPSPPGDFLLWDGFAPTIARVSIIPGPGKVQAKVHQGPGNSYEAAADKIHILGRIKGVWKKA